MESLPKPTELLRLISADYDKVCRKLSIGVDDDSLLRGRDHRLTECRAAVIKDATLFFGQIRKDDHVLLTIRARIVFDRLKNAIGINFQGFSPIRERLFAVVESDGCPN